MSLTYHKLTLAQANTIGTMSVGERECVCPLDAPLSDGKYAISTVDAARIGNVLDWSSMTIYTDSQILALIAPDPDFGAS